MRLKRAMDIINGPELGWRVVLGTIVNGEMEFDYFPEHDEPPIPTAFKAFQMAVIFEAKSPVKYASVSIEAVK